MNEPPDVAAALACRVGPATIADHLAAAVAAGQLIAHDDGSWELPARPQNGPGPWLSNRVPAPFPCKPLKNFLFDIAYRRGRVPWGCRNCYKVKIQAANLRQLLAVREIMDAAPEAGKCGVELGIRQSSGLYAAFFYFDGLDRTRQAFHRLRRVADADPRLGEQTPMLIKRGCTEYEMSCGPSDGYAFAPEQAAVETALLARLRPPPSPPRFSAALTVMGWVQTAFQIGDETYLDVTRGRRLYPRVVTYDPGPPPD